MLWTNSQDHDLEELLVILKQPTINDQAQWLYDFNGLPMVGIKLPSPVRTWPHSDYDLVIELHLPWERHEGMPF